LQAKVNGHRPIPKSTSLGDAISEYRQHLKKVGQLTAYEETYTNAVEHIMTSVGDRSLESIERTTIETLLATLPETLRRGFDEASGATYAPSTVRKIYFQLKKIMVWHSIRHRWNMPPDLFPSKDKLLPSGWDEDRARIRRLQHGEEFQLYSSARRSLNGKEWIRLIALVLETALRAQEILFAEWKDISIDNRIWRVPKKNSKTNKARQVPLTERAVRLLKQQKPETAMLEDRVFGTWKDTRTMGLTFQRICARASVNDFRFHDLRHTAISRLVAEGHPIALLMKISGHSKYITFEKYVNLTDTELVSQVAQKRDKNRTDSRKEKA